MIRYRKRAESRGPSQCWYDRYEQSCVLQSPACSRVRRTHLDRAGKSFWFDLHLGHFTRIIIRHQRTTVLGIVLIGKLRCITVMQAGSVEPVDIFGVGAGADFPLIDLGSQEFGLLDNLSQIVGRRCRVQNQLAYRSSFGVAFPDEMRPLFSFLIKAFRRVLRALFSARLIKVL